MNASSAHEQGDRSEQHRRVALHVSGLDVTQQTTGQAGEASRSVDREVDDVLIDDRVGRRVELASVPAAVPFTTPSRMCLIDPVSGLRQRVLDGLARSPPR